MARREFLLQVLLSLPPYTCCAIHFHKFVKIINRFSLFSSQLNLPSICPAGVRFSKPTFLIIHSRSFSRFWSLAKVSFMFQCRLKCMLPPQCPSNPVEPCLPWFTFYFRLCEDCRISTTIYKDWWYIIVEHTYLTKFSLICCLASGRHF